MITRTRRRLRVSEAGTAAPSPLRVDRDRGVIKGVKVLGFTSANKRRYAQEAVARAVRKRLYEGAKVFVDHPDRPGQMRPAAALLGRLHNARLAEDGVYADLHCNTRHPMWESVAEDCEKGLGLYGLSHNAEAGDYHFEDGLQVITEIARVESVDLVSNPATNKNLWEGSGGPTVGIPLKQWLDERTADRGLPGKARRKIFEMVDWLTEQGDDDAPLMMADEPPAPAAGGADGRSLLAQGVAALIQSGDPADHDLAQKVLKLLKPEATEPVEEEDEDAKDDDADAGEGLRPRRRVAAPAVLSEAEARDLCALADVPITPLLLESLKGLPEANARKVVLAQKALTRDARRGSGPPRAVSGTEIRESRDRIPAGLKATLDWLKE